MCRDDPAQSYALYLPSGYAAAAGKRWPILYLFDARARGAERRPGSSRARPARQGFILASSEQHRERPRRRSERDRPARHLARYAPLVSRSTIGGCTPAASRGAPGVATLMATAAPGTVAGVIGCGAGFHRPILEKPPFVYFGTVGDRDFEFRRDAAGRRDSRPLRRPPSRRGLRRRARLASAGAVRQSRSNGCSSRRRSRERNPSIGLATRLRDWFAGRAAALEGSGRTMSAIVDYDRAIADLRGIADTSRMEEARAAHKRFPGGAPRPERGSAADCRGRRLPLPVDRCVGGDQVGRSATGRPPRRSSRSRASGRAAATVPPSEDGLAADPASPLRDLRPDRLLPSAGLSR
mgnify:CR=1 FL=1